MQCLKYTLFVVFLEFIPAVESHFWFESSSQLLIIATVDYSQQLAKEDSSKNWNGFYHWEWILKILRMIYLNDWELILNDIQ